MFSGGSEPISPGHFVSLAPNGGRCALRDDGHAICWSTNAKLRLSVSDVAGDVVSVDGAPAGGCIVRKDWQRILLVQIHRPQARSGSRAASTISPWEAMPMRGVTTHGDVLCSDGGGPATVHRGPSRSPGAPEMPARWARTAPSVAGARSGPGPRWEARLDLGRIRRGGPKAKQRTSDARPDHSGSTGPADSFSTRNSRRRSMESVLAPKSFAVFTEKRGRSIRRCLMPKTQCHLYFEILDELNVISIIAAAVAVVGSHRDSGFRRTLRRSPWSRLPTRPRSSRDFDPRHKTSCSERAGRGASRYRRSRPRHHTRTPWPPGAAFPPLLASGVRGAGRSGPGARGRTIIRPGDASRPPP